jgi:hypothetical protein
MKAIAIATVISALLLRQPASVSACVCAHLTPCEAFGEASAVFVGRMLSGSEKVEWNPSDSKTSHEAGTVRFAVEETFKGSLGAEVTLSVESNKNTSCGPYGLIRRERYLVYAYGELGALSTGVCTRTELISDAYEDFQFLRSLAQPGTGGRLSGRVWADKGDGGATPLPGVTLTLQNAENQTKKVVTNEEGQFEFANLKPGKYRIEPVWPKHYTSEHPMQEVTIADRGCSTVGFEAKLDGRVDGQVLDSEGRPVSIMLHLEPVEPQKNHSSIIGHSHEDEDGLFEITGIPPGSYLLYFEFQTEGWKNNKKYYYPGVTDPKEATVIEIGLGQTVEGFDFRVPPAFKVRTIEGWVVWPDGSPAKGVEVMLLCPKSTRPDGYTLEFGPPMASTDEGGRFRLQGFKGTSYWLEARAYKHIPSNKRPVEVHSPARPLTFQEDVVGVKLVLSEDGFSAGCRESLKRK